MNDLIVKAQALATVSEDQFEASLAELVADLQAFAAPVTTAPTVVSVTNVIGFSDGTSFTFPVTA